MNNYIILISYKWFVFLKESYSVKMHLTLRVLLDKQFYIIYAVA